MDRKNERSLKPVVVVRRKADAKSSSTGPTTATPQVSSRVPKATAPAAPPPPRTKPPQSVARQASATLAVTEIGPNKKERERQARRDLLEVLRDRWPRAFLHDYRQVKPLAIGIRQDIASCLPDQPPGRIGFVIGIFQQLIQPAYSRAVARGGPRYDLNGQPRGEVTSKEQEHARQDLAALEE